MMAAEGCIDQTQSLREHGGEIVKRRKGGHESVILWVRGVGKMLYNILNFNTMHTGGDLGGMSSACHPSACLQVSC